LGTVVEIAFKAHFSVFLYFGLNIGLDLVILHLIYLCIVVPLCTSHSIDLGSKLALALIGQDLAHLGVIVLMSHVFKHASIVVNCIDLSCQFLFDFAPEYLLGHKVALVVIFSIMHDFLDIFFHLVYNCNES
jgi:hypothetical protein